MWPAGRMLPPPAHILYCIRQYSYLLCINSTYGTYDIIPWSPHVSEKNTIDNIKRRLQILKKIIVSYDDVTMTKRRSESRISTRARTRNRSCMSVRVRAWWFNARARARVEVRFVVQSSQLLVEYHHDVWRRVKSVFLSQFLFEWKTSNEICVLYC